MEYIYQFLTNVDKIWVLYFSCLIIGCYYRFVVRFPIWLDFLFITFRLHFFLSWMSSLSISSSDISASTFSNHVFLFVFQPVFFLQLWSQYIFSPSYMSIPSQSTTSIFLLSQFFTRLFVFHGNATNPSNHLHLCSSNFSLTSVNEGL